MMIDRSISVRSNAIFSDHNFCQRILKGEYVKILCDQYDWANNCLRSYAVLLDHMIDDRPCK